MTKGEQLTEDEQLQAALALSVELMEGRQRPGEPAAGAGAGQNQWRDVTAAELHNLLFGDSASAAVKSQWTSQGIALAPVSEVASGGVGVDASMGSGADAMKFEAGLAQQQGGPCAILAAAQARALARRIHPCMRVNFLDNVSPYIRSDLALGSHRLS
eukprot:5197469-Pleurochrysis_carterae.AAC.1